VVGLTLRPLYCQYELDWSELHGRLNYVWKDNPTLSETEPRPSNP
jgi:hypothetical protein